MTSQFTLSHSSYMGAHATIEHLKSLGGSYQFIEEMTALSERASRGEEEAFATIEEMFESNRTSQAWRENGRMASAVVHALVRTSSSRSMLLLFRFIRSLPSDIPYGTVELLSSLLPSYGPIVIGPTKELCDSHNAPEVRAVGIQTLCNLFLEGKLTATDGQYLAGILNTFEEDRFQSEHHADLVRLMMKRKKDEQSDAHDTDEWRDILVEL